jgi:hypothetical protein
MIDTSNATAHRRGLPGSIRWRSRCLLPFVYVALGAVILIARIASGDTASGLAWFAVMAAVAAFYGFGGRFQVIRQARGDFEDERDAAINRRAMAATGTTLVIVLTGCIVVALARGDNPSPYSLLMAIGGATYAAVLILNRFRS